ncbi:phage tail protein I [Lactobacillus crispatus]|uniref:phage tail protein I n=1 Tax=Lactobacillus crispatus TaxID=47770 RepID=UPI0029C2C642|nr:phage tail protein I [Lactobacillus crispatus]MDX5091597.1 phage tail protein I [Lactobacillus crispatus]
MTNLYNVRLVDLMPESLKKDPDSVAIAEALTPEYQEISREIKKLNLLDSLNQLPEEIVDMLAWDQHVDFYDSSLPIEQKRELVRNSGEWHQMKGTPWAVEQVVSIIFQHAKVSEWFEYGGKPGYFRVETEQALTADTDLDRLIRIINATKRKSIWLESITINRNSQMNLYVGGAISRLKIHTIKPEGG